MKTRTIFTCLLVAGFLAILFRFISARSPHDHDPPKVSGRTQSKTHRLKDPAGFPPNSEGHPAKETGTIRLFLTDQVPGISKKLPDLDRIVLERALRNGSIRPRKDMVLERDPKGRLVAFHSREIKNATLDQLAVSDSRSAEDEAFTEISNTILSGIHRAAEVGADPITELSDLVAAPDNYIGDNEEAKRVLRVARWEAVIALRRLQIDDDQYQSLLGLSLKHSDPILRGTLSGAMLANREDEGSARNWLLAERDSRAIEAFLVELITRDRTTHYPPSSNPRILKDDGINIEIASQEGSWEDYRANSGAGMFKVLGEMLLGRISELCVDDVKPPYSSTTVNGRPEPLRTPLADVNLLLIESLRLRASEHDIPQLQQLVALPMNPEYRARIVAVIGETRSPDAIPLLRQLASPGQSVPERRAAINALAVFNEPSARLTLEDLLWDADTTLRSRAARSLYYGEHKQSLSPRARARVAELAREPDKGDARFYKTFADWLGR